MNAHEPEDQAQEGYEAPQAVRLWRSITRRRMLGYAPKIGAIAAAGGASWAPREPGASAAQDGARQSIEITYVGDLSADDLGTESSGRPGARSNRGSRRGKRRGNRGKARPPVHLFVYQTANGEPVDLRSVDLNAADLRFTDERSRDVFAAAACGSQYWKNFRIWYGYTPINGDNDFVVDWAARKGQCQYTLFVQNPLYLAMLAVRKWPPWVITSSYNSTYHKVRVVVGLSAVQSLLNQYSQGVIAGMVTVAWKKYA